MSKARKPNAVHPGLSKHNNNSVPPPFALSVSKGLRILDTKMLPFYMYILKCFDGLYYVGHTDDIKKKIAMHNEGNVTIFTQRRLPIELVFMQDFATRAEAIEMEQRVKGWSRKKKEALINGNWNELIRLSRSNTKTNNPSTSSGRTERGLNKARRGNATH